MFLCRARVCVCVCALVISFTKSFAHTKFGYPITSIIFKTRESGTKFFNESTFSALHYLLQYW
jgi:hypothetical protein